jgi:hypothetical protein
MIWHVRRRLLQELLRKNEVTTAFRFLHQNSSKGVGETIQEVIGRPPHLSFSSRESSHSPKREGLKPKAANTACISERGEPLLLIFCMAEKKCASEAMSIGHIDRSTITRRGLPPATLPRRHVRCRRELSRPGDLRCLATWGQMRS